MFLIHIRYFCELMIKLQAGWLKHWKWMLLREAIEMQKIKEWQKENNTYVYKAVLCMETAT